MPSLSDRDRVNLEAALTLANKIEIFILGIKSKHFAISLLTIILVWTQRKFGS